MANKRIIDLTASGALAGAHLFEIDTGTLSLKLTAAQLATFIQTALNLLTLTSGNVALSADGSAVFSQGFLQISNDGDILITNPARGLVYVTQPGGVKYRLVMDQNGQLGTVVVP